MYIVHWLFVAAPLFHDNTVSLPKFMLCRYTEYVAYSLSYINDFKGPCIIQIRHDSIVIKKSSGSAIGAWRYNLIREFRFDDENKTFRFTSGRRGPFGLANYVFDLHDRIYYSIRETVNRIAQGGGESESTADSGGSVGRSSNGRCDGRGETSGGEGRRGRLHNELGGTASGLDVGELQPPPVPPHRKESNNSHAYYSLPVVKSLTKQRSASIPDLRDRLPHTKKLPRTSSNSSTKCSPTHITTTNSQRDSGISNSSSIDGENSGSEDSEASAIYQTPRNATVCDYQIPRSQDDPMHQYQVPRPIDRTYMVPRPATGRLSVPPSREVRLNDIEHSYEDPDIVNSNATITFDISRLHTT